MTAPRLWFAGTPEFAAFALEALIAQGYCVRGVLTQPDRPAGRGRSLTPSAVKQSAERHGLPLRQPVQLRPDLPLFDAPPDLVIVAAYGLLLPPWFLQLPRLGCINIHASLLPRWRGAAPIQRAIEAGDAETGISIMQMDAGLDTGAVWKKYPLPIAHTDTAQSLHDALMRLGAQALLDSLPTILAQQATPSPQDEHAACYAHKLCKAEAQLDWHADADTLARRIRAFNPYPIAHTECDGERLRLHEAQALSTDTAAAAGTVVAHHKEGVDIACGRGLLRVTRLQRSGKKAITAAEMRNQKDLTGYRCT